MATYQGVSKRLRELPMGKVLAEQGNQVPMDRRILMVIAATGSGKTMLVPPAIAETTGKRVLVLVPRRFLAVNAKENMDELSYPGDDLAGYAIGKRLGDGSDFDSGDQVVYATYGYAMMAGWLNPKTTPFGTILADEIHEGSFHAVLAQALMRYYRERGYDEPHLGLMSATYDPEVYADYYADVGGTQLLEAEGRGFDCEFREVKPARDGDIRQEGESSLDELALQLIGKEKRKGLLIFRPGLREVEDTAQQLRELRQERLDAIAEQVRSQYTANRRQAEQPVDALVLEALIT